MHTVGGVPMPPPAAAAPAAALAAARSTSPDPGTPLVLDLLGARTALRVVGPGTAELEASIRRAWARCLASAPGSTTAELEVGCTPDAQDVAARDPATLLDALASRLTLEALRARAGDLLLLHAAALADPATGATVVLVAPSGTGKTTAAIALGRRYGYCSDEVAAIQPDGSVLPYPKPLSLLTAGARPKQQVGPDALGLLPAPASPRLAAVLLLDRWPSPGPCEVVPVRTVEALPALAAQSSALDRLPRPLHVLAELLHATGGLRRVRYTEAEDLLPVVAGLVGRAG